MSDADWADGSRLSVGMLLDGTRIGELDHEGQPIVGDSLYVFLNASGGGGDDGPASGPRRRHVGTRAGYERTGGPVATSGPATVQVVAPQAVRIYRGPA
jgi:hypothetical protein